MDLSGSEKEIKFFLIAAIFRGIKNLFGILFCVQIASQFCSPKCIHCDKWGNQSAERSNELAIHCKRIRFSSVFSSGDELIMSS